MTLYEMTQQAKDLYAMLSESADDMGITEEEREQIIADTMQSIGSEEKLEAYCIILQELDKDADAVSKQKKRLDAAGKRVNGEIDRMKAAVLDYYNATGATKPITAGTFRVSRRRDEIVTFTDADKVPDEYCKFKREPSRTEIKKAIKNGIDVPGAELAEKFSAQIK